MLEWAKQIRVRWARKWALHKAIFQGRPVAYRLFIDGERGIVYLGNGVADSSSFYGMAASLSRREPLRVVAPGSGEGE